MGAKDLRIVFMGTPEFAAHCLQGLYEDGYNIVGVVTMPDKASGRGLKINKSAVKVYAESVGLPILQPEKLKDQDFVDQFTALNADLGIVIAFRMLPEVIWAQPRLGTFNLHASLLPSYRGAAPINWAIINGETKTGVTTFMLNAEIDRGDILFQETVEITHEESAGTLHDKLMVLGGELTNKTVDKIAQGDYTPLNQDSVAVDENIIYDAPKIFKNDCLLDFSMDVNELHNKVRGLSPYPCAWSKVKGSDMTVKIFETEIVDKEHNLSFGEVESDGKNYINVACKGGFLSIKQMQPSGKKRMGVADYLRGAKAFDVLEN